MEESEKIGWPIEINIIEEVMFRRGGVFALIYVGSSLKFICDSILFKGDTQTSMNKGRFT